MRRRHSWLVDAVIATADVADDHLVVHAAGRRQPDRRLSLVLNLADHPYAAPVVGEVVESSAPLVGGAVAPDSWAVLAPADATS